MGVKPLKQVLPRHVQQARVRVGCAVRCGPVAAVRLPHFLREHVGLVRQLLGLVEDNDRCSWKILQQEIHLRVKSRAAPFRVGRKRSQALGVPFRIDQLTCGEDPGVTERGRGFLRAGVEQPEGFDRIAEELCAERVRVGGGEDIDNTAPDAEFAGDFHDRRLAIPQPQEAGCERLPLQAMVAAQLQAGRRKDRLRQEPLYDCGNRGDEEQGRPVSQALEGTHAPGNQVGRWRDCFVGKSLPFRKQGYRLRRRAQDLVEETEVFIYTCCGVIG